MNNIIQTIRHTARAATVLLMMLLTTTTAWAVDVTSSTTNWTNGNTYTVTSDVTINTRISVSGTVTLYLGTGTTLTLNQGIEINGGNWLTITGNGTLIVHGPNGADGDNGGDGGSGVNGNLIINSGTVTIQGGKGGDTNMIFDPEVGDVPAGSPGYGGNGINGSLTLNGGTLTIIGGNGGYPFLNDKSGVGITGDITLAGGTLVAPFPEDNYFFVFGNYSNVVIADGYIYKYINTHNHIGYLTGTLNYDQKNNIIDCGLTLQPVAWVGEGSGTEGDPYLITSYNDLLILREVVNGGEAYDGKYFQQTTDIDWPANTTWTSGIGTDADHRFGGHYNGGGNAIRHLTINGTSTNTGLFGYVCGADNHHGGRELTTLKNIVLEDCNIDASSVSGSYASGICASLHEYSFIRIDNCRVSGTISGTSHASGIICKNSISLYVTNCFADVTVSAPHKGKIFAEFSTLYGNDRIVGNYYHDNGDGVGSNGNSYNLTSSQVAPLYTVSGTNLTAAATNATVTHAGTHYFAAGATATLTTDGDHIISGTPTVSGTGASLGSVASDRKSMTLTVGTADVTVSATLQALSGTCGTNATWSMSDTDGDGTYETLTISGTGAMQDYGYTTVNTLWRTNAPWEWQTLTSVTIGDGITAIGDYAFCGCQQLGSITIGSDVANIGYASINHCDALTEVTLPASVATIEQGAFENSINLARVNILKSDGLVTNAGAFNGTALQAIVVPTPALAVQYQSATYWSTHATKLRVPFGSQLFAATNEGGTPAYVIANATDWNNLATAVNGGANGSGQTFRQTANITVSNFTPIGNSEANSFRGTYDGGSKTLTATCNAVSSNYVAPFGYLYGTAEAHASVKDLSVVTTITAAGYKHIAGLIALLSGYVDVTNCNANVSISSTVGTQNPTDLYPAALVSQTGSGGTLTVTGCTATGTISTNGKYAGGLVGIVQGAATITDCVSSVTINSSTSGDGTHGGFVAVVNGSCTITGSVFNGKLLTTGETATGNCAGFIAWGNGSISNCLYAPAAIEGDEAEVVAGTGDYPSGTFYRGTAPSVTNSYYTRALGTAQGKATRTVTASGNATLAHAGVATEYSVSGITAYKATGASTDSDPFIAGLLYNNNVVDVLYAGSGDEVSLTLSNTATGAPDGYQYGYTASAGTLEGSTLTMPNQDVTVSVSTDHLASTGQAVPVPYVDADGTLHDGDNAAQAVALDGSENSLAAGTYFVGLENVNFDHTITLTGNVTLILADNCHMKVGTSGEGRINGNGINGYDSNTHVVYDLTITSQSLGDDMGALSVYTTGMNDGIYASALTINGGNITADTNGFSANALRASGGDLTINSGTVSANTTGTDANALIASGRNFNYNGGNVTATAPNGTAIRTYNGNYTFSWRTPADRITIGATGLYALGNVTATFARLFTDATNIYSGTLTGDDLSTLAGKTLYPYVETLSLAARQAPDENYWTTFYCGHTDYQIDADENACAYTATYADGKLTLHRLGKAVPKATAVIIVADNNEVSMTAATDLDDFSGTNDLRGVDVDTDVDDIRSSLGTGTFYVLGMTTVNGKQHFGFHRYTGEEMAARKAFLHVPGSSNARALDMVFANEETGIGSIESGELRMENFYTLDGRKLNGKPTKPGLYINNGRKVVIK